MASSILFVSASLSLPEKLKVNKKASLLLILILKTRTRSNDIDACMPHRVNIDVSARKSFGVDHGRVHVCLVLQNVEIVRNYIYLIEITFASMSPCSCMYLSSLSRSSINAFTLSLLISCSPFDKSISCYYYWEDFLWFWFCRWKLLNFVNFAINILCNACPGKTTRQMVAGQKAAGITWFILICLLGLTHYKTLEFI